MTCNEIPYATEQGIFWREQGELFAKNRELSHPNREPKFCVVLSPHLGRHFCCGFNVSVHLLHDYSFDGAADIARSRGSRTNAVWARAFPIISYAASLLRRELTQWQPQGRCSVAAVSITESSMDPASAILTALIAGAAEVRS